MLSLILKSFKILSNLSFSQLAMLGNLFGTMLFLFAKKRRNIANTNFKVCFPMLQDKQRKQLTHQTFQRFARALLDRSFIWNLPKEKLKSMILFENIEILHQAISLKRPIIILAPHFVGLDMAWTRLCIEAIESKSFEMISMYSHQKYKEFDKILYNGRLRFNDETDRIQLISRQESIRPIVKALKQNKVFYYLPDLDYGKKDAVFVDFFNYPTATITGLSRLAKLSNAIIFSCFTTQTDQDYRIKFSEIWDSTQFPSDDVREDTQLMNHHIEQLILQAQDQYFWLHKRFKSRPEHQKSIY